MTDKDKNEIKRTILKNIKETKDKITQLEELTKPIAPDVAIGRLTRMEAINEKGLNEASLREAKNTLLKLEQTLKRIDEPNFGKCSLCGQEIPLVRILRVPESSRCVNCVGK